LSRPSLARSCSRQRSRRTASARPACVASSSGTRLVEVRSRSKEPDSFGCGLRRFLDGRGEGLLEVGRPRERHGKTDALDAVRAARRRLRRRRHLRVRRPAPAALAGRRRRAGSPAARLQAR
jgi:hypothetical protein